MEFEFSDEQRQFIDEVMENPDVLRWLAKFRPEGVNLFFGSYLMFRHCWVNFGEFQVQHRDSFLTQHIDEAEKVMYFIQHKKLFDLQCQWRAELVKVPQVNFGAEFGTLALNIQTLDFLPPITAEEVEILKDFLHTTEWAWNEDLCEGWQNHWQFIVNKKAIPKKGFPKFYAYFDQRQGKESLWTQLDDLRAPKESQYSDAYFDHVEKKEAVVEKEDKDPRPHLMDDIKFIGDFAKLVEDRRTNDWREAMEWSADNRHDGLEAALRELKEAKEKIAIEANDDWRTAVMKAADALKRRRIISAIDHAFENYQFRIQNNIGFAPSELTIKDQLLLQKTEAWGESILNGREVMGEPKDWEF